MGYMGTLSSLQLSMKSPKVFISFKKFMFVPCIPEHSLNHVGPVTKVQKLTMRCFSLDLNQIFINDHIRVPEYKK